MTGVETPPPLPDTTKVSVLQSPKLPAAVVTAGEGMVPGPARVKVMKSKRILQMSLFRGHRSYWQFVIAGVVVEPMDK